MRESNSKKCWLITGVSSGLGRAIAEAALARGDSVVGTLRRPEQAAEFEALAPGRAFVVLLDVTDRPRIAPAVAEAIAKLGGLDILVNNAGYAVVGAIEELEEEEETKDVFDTNFYGPLRIIRACLPALRVSRGHIVNISSLGGQRSFPGLANYCASKFAVEGLSEGLAAELVPFGIGVTIVEPGAMRTNFSGGPIRMPANPMSLYDDTPAGKGRGLAALLNGRESGDPAKAALALLTALDSPTPPLRLVLGSDAIAVLRAKFKSRTIELDQWESLSLSTDFEEQAQGFDFKAE